MPQAIAIPIITAIGSAVAGAGTASSQGKRASREAQRQSDSQRKFAEDQANAIAFREKQKADMQANLRTRTEKLNASTRAIELFKQRQLASEQLRSRNIYDNPILSQIDQARAGNQSNKIFTT